MNRSLRTPEDVAAASLARQHGAISGRQAIAAGLTRRQIDVRVTSGRWRRRQRDVFTLAGTPDSWQQRAFVAFLAVEAQGGLLSYVTAAALDALLAPSPLPHVTVAKGRSARCGLAKVHRQDVPPQDRQRRDGLTVTTPSRTLVDMSGVLARRPLEELTDDTLCRGLASVISVEASLDRAGAGHRGHSLLRDVLAVWSPTIEPGSVAEVRLLRLLGELGVVGLVPQHSVYDVDGEFVGRLDLARPDLRCGLEYDGVRFHNPRTWERDERRYAAFRRAGWNVDGVSKSDLVPGETRIATIAGWWFASLAA